jgi:hypothetical protein
MFGFHALFFLSGLLDQMMQLHHLTFDKAVRKNKGGNSNIDDYIILEIHAIRINNNA